MKRLIILVIVMFVFASAETPAFARSGCCSHHGGVRADGCGCNDGSSLSNTCAPYYTCSAGQVESASVQTQTNTAPIAPVVEKKQVYTPVPTVKPTEIPTPTPYKETDMDKKKMFKVLSVIDGETLLLSVRGKEETIRLLGIDIPTLKACFGNNATNKLKSLVEGKFVQVVDDNNASNRDSNNRLLRYVYLTDAKRTFINGELIKQGYAKIDKQAKRELIAKFNSFEKYAKEHNLGLWNSCVVKPTKVGQPVIHIN